MVAFFELTMQQLGGEVNLNNKAGVKIVLGSPPLCCLAPFPCTKFPLTPVRLGLLRRLISQAPMSQFAALYILMSFELSNILSSGISIIITIFQTITWVGGMWGMSMLRSLVGNSLDHTEFGTRHKLAQAMALLLEFQNTILVKIFGAANVYPCFSEHIPGGTFAALLESTLVLIWCLILAIWEHRVYTRVTQAIEESSDGEKQKQLESGWFNSKYEKKENNKSSHSGHVNDTFHEEIGAKAETWEENYVPYGNFPKGNIIVLLGGNKSDEI